MKTRPTLTSILFGHDQRNSVGWCLAACLTFVTHGATAQAAPPTPADDIDYAASGFQLPSGVNPAAWATASGASAAGGMNFASQPAISGPMMMPPRGPRPPGALPIGPGQMGSAPMGSPASMMAMGMPGMGPNGPIMGGPGMQGPMYQNQAQMPGASSIPASFPSGPIPGMGMPSPYGPSPYGPTPYGVMPVGYQHGAGCDGMCGDGGCGGYAMESYPMGGYAACDCGSGDCGGGSCGTGGGFRGLLPKLTGQCGQCRGAGCSSCASRALQNDCIGYGGVFGDMVNGNCMNSDFGLFVGTIGGGLAGLAECLSPYSEAGKCSQRWYDLSAEYMALSSNFSQGGGVLTTRGISGDPVLSVGDADSGDLASGVRLSAAMIMGVGGNIEVTYMGGHEWDDRATATGGEDLFSFISDFGVLPIGGLDDTDRSLTQSLEAETRFHSGEINYRRRVVGPSCTFQGSWLVGLRYVRLDNDLAYDTVGTLNNGAGGIIGTPASGTVDTLRFFSSDVETKNDYFGAQLGYDLWWNATPGVQFGFGMKGAWMQNDWEREIDLFSNSAGPGATAGSASITDRDRLGTVMADIQATMLYRFSHEWTFRTSYHLMAIDDVVDNTLQARFNNVTPNTNPIDNLRNTPVNFGSAVIQGFTVGLEYLW